jgi:hypothetical protein
LGLLELAAELAERGPCDPRTLMRAARDFVESNPDFAMRVGLAALLSMLDGYGYEITPDDVLAAYESTTQAARTLGREESLRRQLSIAVNARLQRRDPVAQVLARAMSL